MAREFRLGERIHDLRVAAENFESARREHGEGHEPGQYVRGLQDAAVRWARAIAQFRALGVKEPAETRRGTCVACGAEIQSSPTGRPRAYCSHACFVVTRNGRRKADRRGA